MIGLLHYLNEYSRNGQMINISVYETTVES